MILVLDDVVFWFLEFVEDVILVEVVVYIFVFWLVIEELNILLLIGIVDMDFLLEIKLEVDFVVNVIVWVDDLGLLYLLWIGFDGLLDINLVVEVIFVLIFWVDDLGLLYLVVVSLDGLGFSVDVLLK